MGVLARPMLVAGGDARTTRNFGIFFYLEVPYLTLGFRVGFGYLTIGFRVGFGYLTIGFRVGFGYLTLGFRVGFRSSTQPTYLRSSAVP
ncbi:hypothetical protein WA1_42960 [Scytonema hofmannii PCC 7110]|uniref:Uncharacterized protein n=1 Tax=Scytonema hofmannii PCC 7110 TaxID=128403 RepID=A0A139WVJ8_9CYAN|nr:hypothetical protein [Scytonema hofmannii]KYC36466.1 hypothetical protein WA1_42960 [Scytonema hofmannii PCC 7110]